MIQLSHTAAVDCKLCPSWWRLPCFGKQTWRFCRTCPLQQTTVSTICRAGLEDANSCHASENPTINSVSEQHGDTKEHFQDQHGIPWCRLQCHHGFQPSILSSEAAGCGGAICANSSRSSAASAWRCCLQRKVARSCKHFTSTKVKYAYRNHQTKTKRPPWYWSIVHESGEGRHGLSMFKWSKKHEACNGLEEGGEIIVAIIRSSCSN